MQERKGPKKKDIEAQTRAFLFNRQRAYQHTFHNENILANAVLEDLSRFCRAEESTFHMDPRAHALAEGRREVWLRIQDHLRMDSEALWMRFSGKGG